MNLNQIKPTSFGILYVVGTPIGNLQDISFRAVEVLRTVDYIAAEDTRQSSILLQHFSINTPLFSFHQHNEQEQLGLCIQRLRQGLSIALISDAGTPLISDPGYRLVQEAVSQEIKVVPIPGPCAAITALCVAGLSAQGFVFEGFLPAQSGSRQTRLHQLKDESRTLIFYEAPHRLLSCLSDMQKIWGGERKIVIARELTKCFETIYRGSLDELIKCAQMDSNVQRGEIVLVVEGAPEQPEEEKNKELHRILSVLLETVPLKQAVDIAAKLVKIRKNTIYQYALEMKKRDS